MPYIWQLLFSFLKVAFFTNQAPDPHLLLPTKKKEKTEEERKRYVGGNVILKSMNVHPHPII